MKTSINANDNRARYAFRRLIFTATFGASLLTAAQLQPFGRPLVFEPNVGQVASQVKWLARGNGYQLFLTADGATMVMREHAAEASKTGFLPALFSPARPSAASGASTASVMRMKLSGSRSWDNVRGLEPTGGASNYFLGNDPNQWHVNVPHYARIQTAGVYDGVDLVLYSHSGELEYDFVVAPYADPKQIRLAFDGVDEMRVDSKTGDLLLTVADGREVRQMRPRVYQQFGNHKVDVTGAYEILDRKQATFALAAYDRERPLVIDPTVAFTTFLAGSNEDEVSGIAVDGSGNAYVTGFTLSMDFPTVGPIQMDQQSTDVFVTKLSATGTILFSTYLGGSSNDHGNGIVVDSTGVYITGGTSSSNFPTHTSLGPAPQAYHSRAFVAKLNLSGNSILYSTSLSGSLDASAEGITVDSMGTAWVAGYTASTDFPMAPGVTPLQAINHGGADAFIARLSATGASLLYSTYWGGSSVDYAFGVAVDASGYVYVTGSSQSSTFPITTGMRACNSGYKDLGNDGFVLKFSPGKTVPTYSTCFGAMGTQGRGIKPEGNGNAYITGATSSPNFPTTTGAWRTVKVSNGSAFVTKLSNVGAMVYSTYLEGNDGGTSGLAIALNPAGEIYVAGYTSSTTFPDQPGFTPNPYAGFVAKLTPQLSGIDYVTFLGAVIRGVAVYQQSSPLLPHMPTYPQVYVGGFRYTGSISSSAEDAFVSRVDESSTVAICCAVIL